MVRPRQFTDEQILESARRCFLEHGPGVSTSAIARAVGMSQAALFKRFKNKQELMISALMISGPPAWVMMVLTGPDDRDLREQLLEIAGAIEQFFDTAGPAMAILRASGISEQQVFSRFDGPPPPVVGQRALSNWFRAARDAGRIRAVDPDAAAMMLLGSLIARMFFKHIFGPAADMFGDPAELADIGSRQTPSADYVASIVDNLWRGIAPEGAPPSTPAPSSG